MTYFVTFRLTDSIPKQAMIEWLDQRNEWLNCHSLDPTSFHSENLPENLRSDYNNLFGRRFHDLLDSGYGSCLLSTPENAQIIFDSLQHFNQERYHLGSFVVMPNHVHFLITPLAEYPLPKILQSLKSFTAKQINKCENRIGQLWQVESYDHIVRSEHQLAHYQTYIRENPAKAHLPPRDFLLWEPKE